jgi:hypothetical protein
MKKAYLITGILLFVLLAACQPQATATQAPPQATSAPAPTATATPVPTSVHPLTTTAVPPSETPTNVPPTGDRNCASPIRW